jgi:hypothetical protein
MGDESKRIGAELIPEFQAKSPLDFFKISPGGIGTEEAVTAQFQKAMKAQEDYANALEQRYNQPNWFNVAAGFAKPQLGGFLASLGSASQVLGEQQEAQKAIMPTIARMRAEVAAGQLGFEQRTTQKKMFDDIKAGKLPMDEQTLQKLGEFGTDTDIYKSAKDYFETQSKRQNQVINALVAQKDLTSLYAEFGVDWVNNQIDQIRKRFPNLEVPPGYRPSLSKTEGAPTSAAPSAAPAPTTPPGATVSASAPPAPEPAPPAIQGAPGASNLPRAAQVEAGSRETAEKIDLTRKTNDALQTQANNGAEIFKLAKNIYGAAAKKSLEPAFGMFEQGDALGVIGKALEDQQVSNVLGNVREQIQNARLGEYADPEKKKSALADLQVLERELSALQTLMQQGIINPTDMRTMYEAKSVPGKQNTQEAFLRSMARLASEGLSKYELNQAFQGMIKNPKFDIYTWTSSPAYASTMNKIGDRNSAIVKGTASYTMPSFMERGFQAEEPAQQRRTAPAQGPARSIREEARRRGIG